MTLQEQNQPCQSIFLPWDCSLPKAWNEKTWGFIRYLRNQSPQFGGGALHIISMYAHVLACMLKQEPSKGKRGVADMYIIARQILNVANLRQSYIQAILWS